MSEKQLLRWMGFVCDLLKAENELWLELAKGTWSCLLAYIKLHNQLYFKIILGRSQDNYLYTSSGSGLPTLWRSNRTKSPH